MTEDKPREQEPGEDMKQLDELLGDGKSGGNLTNSLNALPKVHAPSDFVPGVMSKVYTHHARTQVSFLHIGLVLLLLFGCSFVFFVLDTHEYMTQNEIGDFGQAFSQRFDLMMANYSNAIESTSQFLTAAWQIVSATGKAFVAEPSRLLLVLLAMAAVVGLFLIRKWALKP